MTDSGGGGQAQVRRSRLAEYAEMAGPAKNADPPPVSAAQTTSEASANPAPAGHDESGGPPGSPGGTWSEADARSRRFTKALATFRENAVLVPVRDRGWLTADFGGVRWILAFSDEPALARYALAQGEGHEEWTYETVLGARLLDVAVPEAGVPCGVALDAADGAEQAVLFPPVAGIVPDAYAVNKGYVGETAMTGRTEEQR
ncbi:hypothetical protein [Streptomyces sp. CoH27]|uniref:hypothetical protein n=1 Tax=Streptomyces sp. CoH27 TaxID=2875763 RepID=UPI001CD24E49|nr:hypothetical protein [Streptomyces sp. CoH27]